MIRKFAIFLLACLSSWSPECLGQGKGSINGNVFREPTLGLTYEFPEKLSPELEGKSPIRGDEREHVILTLWEAPQHSGALRIAFLYDTKQRSSDRTRDTISLAYIGEVKASWMGVKNINIVGPAKYSQPSYDYWRLDMSAPDQAPRYNSMIVITLSDRRVLAIRAAAPSQSELDNEVDSLAHMRFDQSQK